MLLNIDNIKMKYFKHIFTSLIFLSVISCFSENRSVDIYSYKIDDITQRKSTLLKYIPAKDSGFIDCAYHIWFKDNEQGMIPGPSDFLVKYAMKIPPDSLDKWIIYLEPLSGEININRWKELQLNPKKWALSSEPELYHTSLKTEIKLLFREENIILGMYSSMPLLLN